MGGAAGHVLFSGSLSGKVTFAQRHKGHERTCRIASRRTTGTCRGWEADRASVLRAWAEAGVALGMALGVALGMVLGGGERGQWGGRLTQAGLFLEMERVWGREHSAQSCLLSVLPQRVHCPVCANMYTCRPGPASAGDRPGAEGLRVGVNVEGSLVGLQLRAQAGSLWPEDRPGSKCEGQGGRFNWESREPAALEPGQAAACRGQSPS